MGLLALIGNGMGFAYIYPIYRYEIWLSLAIKIMALHPTPLEFLPHTRTRYALASEIGLLAGHVCVLARLLFTVAQKPTLEIGVVAHVVVRCMRVVGRSLLAYSRSKETRTRKLHHEPPFDQNLAHEYSSSC
jgi:hypothetical protein